MDREADIVIGEALRQVRTERGITQYHIAEELLVPQSFVSKTERGQRSLRVSELFCYADALGMDSGELARRLRSAFVA